MKKKEAREQIKKVWNLQFKVNKILWMLSYATAIFAGESDRSVNLGEKTKEESQETKQYLLDVIKGIVIVLCKEAQIEDEELQDSVFSLVLKTAAEIQLDRLKKESK